MYIHTPGVVIRISKSSSISMSTTLSKATCGNMHMHKHTFIRAYMHVIICVASPLLLLLQKQEVASGPSAKLHSQKFLSLFKTAYPQKEPQVCGAGCELCINLV